MLAPLKTPFTTDNKFTKVKPSYAPPSPTQSVRRAHGSPSRGLSSLSRGRSLTDGITGSQGRGKSANSNELCEPGRTLVLQDSLASIGSSTVFGGRTPDPGQDVATDIEMEADDEEPLGGLRTPKRLQTGRGEAAALVPTAEIRAPRSSRLKRAAEPDAPPGRKDSGIATPTKRRRDHVTT